MKLPWKKRVGPLIRAGDAAMRQGEWAKAAACYEQVLSIKNQDAAIWIQYGHALHEQHDFAAAELAYGQACAASPGDLDARLYHARISRALGRTDKAITAYAEILKADPQHRTAYTELVHLGGRQALPKGFRQSGLAASVPDLRTQLKQTQQKLRYLADLLTFSPSDYGAFREQSPVQAPPKTGEENGIHISIEVDATETSAYFLRATLLSLADQRREDWSARIFGSGKLEEHSVASIAHIDPRIEFVPDRLSVTATSDDEYVLSITGGTILDRHALDWFGYVIQRTGCEAAWCDSDHAVQEWGGSSVHERPVLWAAFDADIIAQTTLPPVAVLARRSVAAALDGRTPSDIPLERHRQILLAAGRTVAIAHIPRILATVLRLPERAATAPEGDETIALWATEPLGSPPLTGPMSGTDIEIVPRRDRPSVSVSPIRRPSERIQIIIPTRDQPELLSTAIDTLIRKAAATERLSFTIVDNRSSSPEALLLLDNIRGRSGMSVVVMDEPFNWSRANDIGARSSDADHILFANNDIEMLTEGWDDLLLGYLQRADVGAVGARLLYPDHSLQHGGILFGAGEGSPIHEGAGLPSGNSGPWDRFDLTHTVAAVTGAFMALSRALFNKVGGLDALRLAISYNDVDLCLRIRAEGKRILYTPAIELIHHESKTRGFNDNRAKIAWDQGELRSIHDRWGRYLTTDPGYNPQLSTGDAYGGFREPSKRELVEHIDRCARPNPWLTHPTPVEGG